ncbi:hypothetical protein HAX54_048986, partial [Datura stramonium]|nr:hypothetical protein [Datura stramonium]
MRLYPQSLRNPSKRWKMIFYPMEQGEEREQLASFTTFLQWEVTRAYGVKIGRISEAERGEVIVQLWFVHDIEDEKWLPNANLKEKLRNRSVFDNLCSDFLVAFSQWDFDPLELTSCPVLEN